VAPGPAGQSGTSVRGFGKQVGFTSSRAECRVVRGWDRHHPLDHIKRTKTHGRMAGQVRVGRDASLATIRGAGLTANDDAIT